MPGAGNTTPRFRGVGQEIPRSWDMDQQQQTLEYFRRHARDWQRRTEATGEAKVNVVRQRHAYVEKVAGERRPTKGQAPFRASP